MVLLRSALLAASVLLLMAGCASSQQKLRLQQREKAIQANKLYCEFINGEQFPDMDVALNLAMAQKCDSEKSMTMTSYKTPSDLTGIMFCCSVHPKAIAAIKRAEQAAEKAAEKTSEKGKADAKKADAKKADAKKIDDKSAPPPVDSAPPPGGADDVEE